MGKIDARGRSYSMLLKSMGPLGKFKKVKAKTEARQEAEAHCLATVKKPIAAKKGGKFFEGDAYVGACRKRPTKKVFAASDTLKTTKDVMKAMKQAGLI